MIKSVNFDGKQKKTIIDAGANAWDIILDPESRKMFWSTMMRVIYVSSMDGAQKKRLITENIEFASGLSIDFPSRRLYWCDLRKSTIESSTLDGNDRQIVRMFDGINPINNLPVSPVKLDIFEDELYVTMTNQSIYRLNKFGLRREYEEINNGPYKFRASHIKLIHTFKNNISLPNPCLLYPCDDSAVCFLSSADQTGRTCNCPDNLFIQKNGTHVSCLHKSEIPSLCYKPCVNDGKCKYVDDDMTCECLPQFEGEHCEHYVCSEYCKNNGICVLPTDYRNMNTTEVKLKRVCQCSNKWKGPRCEVPSTVCRVIFTLFIQ
jgi:integrin beta 2